MRSPSKSNDLQARSNRFQLLPGTNASDKMDSHLPSEKKKSILTCLFCNLISTTHKKKLTSPNIDIAWT
jgi:hypothetical protein